MNFFWVNAVQLQKGAGCSNHRIMKFGLFFVSLIFSLNVVADGACTALFLKSPKVFKRWIPESQRDLAASSVTTLKVHSLYAFANTFVDQGQGLEFVFRGAFLKNFRQTTGVKGEGQQALLIKKYIEFLFPRANLRSQSVEEFDQPIPISPGKTQIQLYFLDRAEYTWPPASAAPNVILEMALLKAGNPGSSVGTKTELRSQLGISDRAKVLSLYVKNEKVFYEKSSDLLAAIRRGFDFDVLILSLAMQWEPGVPTKLVDLELGEPFLKSFEAKTSLKIVREGELATKQNVYIFNDTVGLMPHVHTVADLAVVVGPINFMQSLNAGTRTLLWSNSELRGTYRRSVLEQLIAVAGSSGGFAATETIADFPSKIRDLFNGPAPVSPAVQKIEGSSPLEKVLDKLEVVIRSQID